MNTAEAGYMDWNPPVRAPEVTVNDVHRYATERHKLGRAEVAAVEAAMEIDPNLRGLVAEMARTAADAAMALQTGFVPRRYGHLLVVVSNA